MKTECQKIVCLCCNCRRLKSAREMAKFVMQFFYTQNYIFIFSLHFEMAE
jgi:hypothetical protein